MNESNLYVFFISPVPKKEPGDEITSLFLKRSTKIAEPDKK